VKAYSPGTTGDLIVKVDGKVIFQKKTHGNLDDNTAPEMIKKLYIVARD
jgi:predicted Rdx family selenoprotein